MKVYIDPYFTTLKHGVDFSSEVYNVLFLLYTDLKKKSKLIDPYNSYDFYSDENAEFIQSNLRKIQNSIENFTYQNILTPIDLEGKIAKTIWPQKKWEDRKILIKKGLQEILTTPLNIDVKIKHYARKPKKLINYWEKNPNIEYVADPILSKFYLSNKYLYFFPNTITGALSTRNIILSGCPSFPLTIFDIQPRNLMKTYVLLRSSSRIRKITITKDFYLHLYGITSKQEISYHLNQLKELNFLKSFNIRERIEIIWW